MRWTDPVKADEENVIVDDFTEEDYKELLEALNTADLSVAVTSTPSPVEVGASLAYELTVSNLGPNSASEDISPFFSVFMFRAFAQPRISDESDTIARVSKSCSRSMSAH